LCASVRLRVAARELPRLPGLVAQFEQAIAASLRLSVLLVRSRVPGFFVACCILTIRSSGPRTARCAKLVASRPRPLTSSVRPHGQHRTRPKLAPEHHRDVLGHTCASA
jgi:hypothetical protein